MTGLLLDFTLGSICVLIPVWAMLYLDADDDHADM